MRRAVKRMYTVYAAVWFLLLLIVLFPLYFVLIGNKKWHKHTHTLNRFWARTVLALCFIPVHIERRGKYVKGRPYIFCSNHFSYLDIASMVFTPSDFMFTGKESLTSVPGIGYIFRKLHITVDRFSKEGRKSALDSYFKALEQGKSLVIFPEGGIYAEKPPQMGPFRHGAFTAAIEKKVPVVPVSIPFNWIILPDNGKFLMKRHKVKIIFHEPIETAGLTMDDLEQLKDRTYNIIQEELDKHNSYADRLGNAQKDRAFSQT